MVSLYLARAGPSHARRIGAGVGALVLIVGVGAFVHQLADFEARPLSIAGVQLPEGDPEAFVRQLALAWYETELSIDAGPQIVRATRRELGGRLDVDASVEEARLARGMGPLTSRVFAFATRERQLTWHRGVHDQETTAFTEELRRRTVIDPEPRSQDGEGGRPGTSLNLVGATRAITEALRSDALVVALPVRRLEPPTRPHRSRQSARFTEVVSAHETRYQSGGTLSGRAQNIELAARHLDGAVIAPHGELSFNAVVGERTFERGFAPATELAGGGRRTEGIGGGVCQVAATLHAAAFFGGFEIPEHHPHTRNSTYIPAGLDSAVSWPNKDVRIRNPYEFHIRIRATAYRGTLRVELMGARRAPRVEWNTQVIRRIQRGTEREVDPNMPLGSEEVLDEGEDGSVMERTRTVDWPRGAVTETATLRYPLVTRLVRVGSQSVRESE